MNNSILTQSQILQDFQTENQTIHSQINQNISFSQDKKRHRRSKHEQKGRNYTCEHCGKAYLSKPALNNHMNTKHAEILKELHIEKRKRGRPRKYIVDNNEKNNYEKLKFNPFFQNFKRGKNDLNNEVINIKNVVDIVFNNLFVKYGKNFSKIIYEPKENPILNYLLNNKELDLKICDDIICKYLNYIEPFTNENYFIFAIKFIILFRECINVTQRKEQKYIEKEYTIIENAEIIPEQCNEFFSNFLEKYKFFDFNDEDKNELIEIIQHFCFWLFINNFTKSKLSLAS